MENNPNYFQEILSKNQYFLKEYTELNYNIRNNYLLFGYGLSSNNEQVLHCTLISFPLISTSQS